jgi:hypothetical protein
MKIKNLNKNIKIMSFSNQKLSNPCEKFIEFKNGKFQYWDKEKEKNIELKLPFYFIILDQLSTIKGFNDENQCGIYSNEIHSVADEILNVRTFKGKINIIGLYNEIKGEIKSIGGRYCKSIYALMFDKSGKAELVNFQLTGAAFSSFVDAKIKVNKYSIGVEGTEEKTKGTTIYQQPIFKKYKLPENHIETAIEVDKQLQEYFNQYKQEQKESVIEKEEKTEPEIYHDEFIEPVKTENNINNDEVETDDLPF